MIGFLAHEIVIGGYHNRSDRGRLTGEWIVYASQNGRNTYLTLGIHGDDDAIFGRVLNCVDEFPDLLVNSET